VLSDPREKSVISIGARPVPLMVTATSRSAGPRSGEMPVIVGPEAGFVHATRANTTNAMDARKSTKGFREQ
jgi:hypothetical protein